LFRILKRDPVDFGNGELAAQKLFGWTSRDAILFSINRNHVQRAFVCDAHSTTLSNRVTMNALMAADDTASCINYFTGARQTFSRIFCYEISIDKAGVITVRNKTDFLRFFLF